MFLLHSYNSIQFSACMYTCAPGTCVCSLYSRAWQVIPYRPSDSGTAYHVFVDALGLPVGPAHKHSVISGKIIFQSNSKAKSSFSCDLLRSVYVYCEGTAVQRKWKDSVVRCYCTDLIQKYSIHFSPNKPLSVKLTLNLFQQLCGQSE